MSSEPQVSLDDYIALKGQLDAIETLYALQLKRLRWCYERTTDKFVAPVMTFGDWLRSIDAALEAKGTAEPLPDKSKEPCQWEHRCSDGVNVGLDEYDCPTCPNCGKERP